MTFTNLKAGKPMLDLLYLRDLIPKTKPTPPNPNEVDWFFEFPCYTIELLADYQEHRISSDGLWDELPARVPGQYDCKFEAAADAFQDGLKKYARYNYMNGCLVSVAMGAASRHARQMLAGVQLDEFSGLPHSYHIAANFYIIMRSIIKSPENDNRPPKSLFHPN